MIDRPGIFRHPLRVRYSEIDVQGIVYNAHYLTFFDIGLIGLAVMGQNLAANASVRPGDRL